MRLFDMARTYKNPWIDRHKAYFAIIFTPRSGSNYLAELLDSSDEITCHTEIFSKKSTYLSRQAAVPYIHKEERDRDLWSFLRRLISYASGSHAFGFKIGMYDLRSMLIYVLFSRQVKKLIVRRRNLLAAFLSLKEAERSGAWIRWRDDQGQGSVDGKLRLSLWEFHLFCLKMIFFYFSVRMIEILTLQKFKWLSYETMMDGNQVEEIAGFLHVRLTGDLMPRTKKQNKKRLRDKIDNIESVEIFMRAINAKWMLNERG